MGCIDDWDHYAEQFCPVQDVLGQVYHWSLRQVKYSTDLMFRSEQILVPIYDAISRQAVLAANAERVSGFLGKKITPQLAQEIGSRLSTRIEGRCIKHYMGFAGVKVYDKFSRVLRVETTINDVSFFKHYRKVEQKAQRHDQGCGPGTSPGLAHGEGTGQAIHGRATGQGGHARTASHRHPRNLDSQGPHLPHRGEQPDSKTSNLVRWL